MTDLAQVEDRIDARLRPGTLYLGVAVVMTSLVALAGGLWPAGTAPPRAHVAFDAIIGNWLWWDGQWYLEIARHGYSYHPGQQSSVAFFPGYPIAIRLIGAVLPGGQPVAAVAITAVCGAGVLVAFHRWTLRHLGATSARTATICFAIYPYAWYLYGAAYADAMFLASAMVAFLLLDADHPLAAAVAGAVATATRPTGIVVAVGLIAIVLDRRRRQPTTAAPRDFAVVASVAGLIAWCGWLAYRFGNPFAFIATEGARGWDRTPGFHTWLKLPLIVGVLHDGPGPWMAHLVQVVLCLAFVCFIPAVWRRFGRGYGIYTATAVLLPAFSTDDFMGTGRYFLAAFPIFAIVGERLTVHPIGRNVYTILSGTALAFGATLFATGHYLS